MKPDGTCPDCHHVYPLRKDGALYMHGGDCSFRRLYPAYVMTHGKGSEARERGCGCAYCGADLRNRLHRTTLRAKLAIAREIHEAGFPILEMAEELGLASDWYEQFQRACRLDYGFIVQIVRTLGVSPGTFLAEFAEKEAAARKAERQSERAKAPAHSA